MLRIAGKLGNRATQLSGGEMQRVAIGRALVRRPSIYLMDEPLSSLDAKLRADLRLELKRIQQELGATILYVTHDQTEAMTMANRIGVIEKGRLIQVGSPRADLHRPGEHLCRDPARPAGDQPHPGRAHPDPAPARRRQDGRRAHRASSDRQGGERRGGRQGRLDRASRRPEPPPCQRRRPASSSRWSIRSAGLEAATRSRLTLLSIRFISMPPAIESRLGARPDMQVEARPMTLDDATRRAADRDRRPARHRSCRRTDRARPGDRRRRPRRST